MLNQQIDLTRLPIAPPLDWRIGFGLFLRNTPSQKRRKRAELTLQAYERDMNLMAAWFEAKYGVPFEPCQLNVQNVGEYFSQFEREPATHKRKLASLRLFIRWAMEAEIIEEDPSIWIAYMDAVEKAPRSLTDEERKQLEAAAEAGESSLLGLRDSLLFFLMDDAGLRISETIGLLRSDVHLDKGYIEVTGKGMKRRRIEINNRLIGKIRLWLDRMPDLTPNPSTLTGTRPKGEGSGTLLTDERGFSICRQTAWTRFVLLREQAGVNATPHGMRHTYVIRLMDAFMNGNPKNWGTALQTVCMQTGDDEKTISKYYTRPRYSDIRAAVEAM